MTTVDDLAQAYDEAYENRARLEFPTPEMKRAMHRAGIRAVVERLRDEFDFTSRSKNWSEGEVHDFFSEILASEGEKMAGLQRMGQEQDAAPATDPAPAERSDATAVCEWTKRKYEPGFYATPHGIKYRDIPFPTCPFCGKPIKFTEAK